MSEVNKDNPKEVANKIISIIKNPPPKNTNTLTTSEIIDIKFRNSDYQILRDALSKYRIVKELNNTLKTNETVQTKLDTFHGILANKENVAILTKRRDTAFVTFVKTLGVTAATILGLPLAGFGAIATGYLAYKRLFSTHGGKFIDEVAPPRENNEVAESSKQKKTAGSSK